MISYKHFSIYISPATSTWHNFSGNKTRNHMNPAMRFHARMWCNYMIEKCIVQLARMGLRVNADQIKLLKTFDMRDAWHVDVDGPAVQTLPSALTHWHLGEIFICNVTIAVDFFSAHHGQIVWTNFFKLKHVLTNRYETMSINVKINWRLAAANCIICFDSNGSPRCRIGCFVLLLVMCLWTIRLQSRHARTPDWKIVSDLFPVRAWSGYFFNKNFGLRHALLFQTFGLDSVQCQVLLTSHPPTSIQFLRARDDQRWDDMLQKFCDNIENESFRLHYAWNNTWFGYCWKTNWHNIIGSICRCSLQVGPVSWGDRIHWLGWASQTKTIRAWKWICPWKWRNVMRKQVPHFQMIFWLQRCFNF